MLLILYLGYMFLFHMVCILLDLFCRCMFQEDSLNNLMIQNQNIVPIHMFYMYLDLMILLQCCKFLHCI